jgi:hypothetical protein
VNGDRFDDLTRLLASHTTRRWVLTTAVWGAVALLAGAPRLSGIHAAAGSGALTSQMCSQQDQVSSTRSPVPSRSNGRADCVEGVGASGVGGFFIRHETLTSKG